MLSYDRVFRLEAVEIRRGGDGRIVEAYAAVYDTPVEVRDQHGHYTEVIARSSFNRAISHGTSGVSCFYNHGKTINNESDPLLSVPLDRPLEVKSDSKGLLTVTRFNKSDLSSAVLESIRNGDLTGYSFRGRIHASHPSRVPARRPGGPLPTVTRTELGLTEYGPTPSPYYTDAVIVAVRAMQRGDWDLG